MYKLFLEEDDQIIMEYEKAVYLEKKTYEQFIAEGGKELPQWYRSDSGDVWAEKQIDQIKIELKSRNLVI